MSENQTVTRRTSVERAEQAEGINREDERFYSKGPGGGELGRMGLYPIHPESRLYLDADGHRNDAPFAFLLRLFWESIPPTKRCSMLEHSRPWECTTAGLLSRPWKEAKSQSGSPYACGETRRSGPEPIPISPKPGRHCRM